MSSVRASRWATRWATLAILACALGSVACAPPPATKPKGPSWVGIDQQAFPDDIAPAALGLPGARRKPYADPQIRERTRRADVVARVRVKTFSVERRSNGDPVFRVGLELGTRLVDRLKGDAAMPDLVEVLIVPESPAHGLARAYEERIRTAIFVGFLKRYADARGDGVIHFHLDPDDPAIGQAVQQFAALDEVRGS